MRQLFPAIEAILAKKILRKGDGSRVHGRKSKSENADLRKENAAAALPPRPTSFGKRPGLKKKKRRKKMSPEARRVQRKRRLCKQRLLTETAWPITTSTRFTAKDFYPSPFSRLKKISFHFDKKNAQPQQQQQLARTIILRA